jgi:hypothetical protein
MKGNVNPFEPWRPSRLEVPPPLHAGRPWRPPAPARAAEPEPPLVEPVDPPARKSPPKGPPERDRRRPPERERCRRLAEPSTLGTPVSELRADQKIVLTMFFALGVLGLVGLGGLGGTHLPRVFFALLAVAIGCTVGISMARRRSWFARLGWMASGLALAGLAGWFVPTTKGVNLWSAYRQVDQLRSLPAGDTAGYSRGVQARKAMVSEFPTFAEDVAAAEHAWFRRTVDTAIETADRHLESEPHKALRGLHQLNAELARLEHYGIVKAELEAAHKRVVQACLQAAMEEIEDLLGKKQFAVVAQRGAFWAEELAGAPDQQVELRERLLPKRRQALAARLEAARKEITDLLHQDRFRAIAKTGAKLAKELGDEAKEVGMADDLDRLCAGCALFGDLARQANKPDPR